MKARKQVPSSKVRRLLGGVSRTTQDRYRADPRLAFPQPIERRGRLYWYEDEIVAWLDSRPRVVVLRKRGKHRARPPCVLTANDRRRASEEAAA